MSSFKVFKMFASISWFTVHNQKGVQNSETAKPAKKGIDEAFIGEPRFMEPSSQGI